MSVQKKPDRSGGVDEGKTQWEKDLKPFTRLPRDRRPNTAQKWPAWIPMLVSLIAIVPLCVVVFSMLDRIRPAANALLPTATITIIIPTATQFVPPTATPYVAPTDTPVPAAAAAVDNIGGPIAIGRQVKVSDTNGGGLNFRDKPSTTGTLLRKLPEGGVYEVVGGPRDADGYTWWQLKDPADGVTGWGAAKFLQPAS